MDYRFRIAQRYLFSRKRISPISIITGISMGGVALGVAALIVVLSVMNGFYTFARDLLVSLDPHVRIVAVAEDGLATADSLLALARGLPHVTYASTYVEGKALVAQQTAAEANKVVIVRGIEEDALEGTTRVAEGIVRGAFSLERRDGRPGIVVGAGLTHHYDLVAATGPYRGSDVTLLSAAAIESALTNPFAPPRYTRFEVRGTFEMEAAYDESHVFIATEEAQKLFRMPGRVTGLELRLDDLDRAAQVKAQLEARLDTSQVRVKTWYDLHRALYDVMALEKWGASAVLFIIVIVAAFNIVGSLMMVVIEKRRDVGVLAALGVSRKGIRQLFLLEGALIGLVGTGAGVVLGLGLALAQQHFGLVKLSGTADSFLIAAYPVDIHSLDVLGIAAAAFGLCVLASVYPARRASLIEPAQAVTLE